MNARITTPLSHEERQYLKQERHRVVKARTVGRNGAREPYEKRTSYWPPLVTVAVNGQITGETAVAHRIAHS